MTASPLNHELQLATGYVRDTGCHIFLTGKAGTGKTTFLQTLPSTTDKRLVITAPTGVAALNAGGVTIHSFFQLPLGPFIPGSDAGHIQIRFRKDKISVLQSLDLLVIDEISMVRADVLDAVDSVLRRVRRSRLPFGGVQLLMIGDLYQLPPVVKGQEWLLLQPYYKSPYFFDSQALAQAEMVTIELSHIYRQSDPHFIDLLNKIRNGRVDTGVLGELNRRHFPGYTPDIREGYITLCSHNRLAEALNTARLRALPQNLRVFEAEIEGEFPEHIHPTARTLRLKTGAQVMFIRNDTTAQKRFFNGKIGTITRISGETIRVQCPGDAEEIEVEPTVWENIDYSFNRETLEITQTRIGAFTQYPLALAWGITIHKSQGLTFDKAVIDAQAAFAHGQVYVALSRCRTLEGMILSTPLTPAAIQTDAVVQRYHEAAKGSEPSIHSLKTAKISYQQRLLMECFDFERLRSLLRRLMYLLAAGSGGVQVSGVTNLRESHAAAENDLCTVGDRFRRQLQGLFSPAVSPVADPVVLERLSKASVYFQDQISRGIGTWIDEIEVDTDNKEMGKKIRNTLDLLKKEVEVKRASVRCCGDGFTPAGYFRAVSGAEVTAKGKKERIKEPLYLETDVAHPELFQVLKAWRREKAKEEGVDSYQVLHQKTLVQIAIHLPDTMTALKRIHGIGKRLAARYGDALIAMVMAYRDKHHIREVALPVRRESDSRPQKEKTVRIDTKTETLKRFEAGMPLFQIASERGLALSTIEGHMAQLVERGEVAVESLVSFEKRQTIEKTLSKMADVPLSEIKKTLGEAISYGEILMVRAHLRRQTDSLEDEIVQEK